MRPFGKFATVPTILFAVVTSALATSFSYTTIDVPGIAGPKITAIDNAGELLGYGGAGEVSKGFLKTGAAVSTIFVPGSAATEVFGLNDNSQIVGTFSGASGNRAFLYMDGIVTNVDVPGPIDSSVAHGINNSGDVAGYFSRGGLTTGFLDAAGTVTTLLFPGSAGTEALGINDAGQIVGKFFDSKAGGHAFIYRDGVFTPITAPGVGDPVEASGINSAGEIVGQIDIGAETQGFLDENGVFSIIAVPGAAQTEAVDINDAGQIVGNYLDNSGQSHPFLASPVSAVPEPNAIVPVTVALLLILFRGICRRRIAGSDKSSAR